MGKREGEKLGRKGKKRHDERECKARKAKAQRGDAFVLASERLFYGGCFKARRGQSLSEGKGGE